jgi:hypothetical protein
VPQARNKGQELGTWHTIDAHEDFKGIPFTDSLDSKISTSISVLKTFTSNGIFCMIIFFIASVRRAIKIIFNSTHSLELVWLSFFIYQLYCNNYV